MDTKRNRQKRVRRFVAYGLVILTAVVTAGIGFAYYQFQKPPRYWSENQKYLDQTDPQDVDQLAWETENVVLNLLTKMPGYSGQASGQVQSTTAQEGVSRVLEDKDGVLHQQINLTTHQINAWLGRRLESWAANQSIKLPSEISDVMMHTEGGHIVTAFRFKKGQIDAVVSCVFNITITEPGKALVHLVQLRTGSLPATWTTKLLNDKDFKRLITRLKQGEKADLKFPHSINDKLTVTVNKLTIHANGVMADVVTK
ncbi:MAG: hypothetical protein ACF8OB_02090 [Phycisphaeraceae bacterium JB051]